MSILIKFQFSKGHAFDFTDEGGIMSLYVLQEKRRGQRINELREICRQNEYLGQYKVSENNIHLFTFVLFKLFCYRERFTEILL